MSVLDSTLDHKENQAGFLAAFDSLSIAMFRIDEDGMITDTNPTAQSMLGLGDETPWPERHYAQNKVLQHAGLCDAISRLFGQPGTIWKRRIDLHLSPGRVTSVRICLWPDDTPQRAPALQEGIRTL